MEQSVLQVQMLGNFSLTLDGRTTDDTKGRSKKVWALLAVLLCRHGQVVSQKELIDLLWNDDKEGGNPTSALKTTLHRVRTLLDQLIPDGGRRMIVNQRGGYLWQEPLQLDIDRFEKLCRPAPEETADQALDRCRRALEVYQGPFLDKLSGETWVVPRATYYHDLYLRTVDRALELMETKGLWEEAAGLCRAALKQEPYQETLYQHLMRNLLARGSKSQAVKVYEDMSRLLLSTFGVMPDQESRRLYREALRTVNRRAVEPDILREQLRETAPLAGAMVCDYDFFKMICQAEARRMCRTGEAVHYALLTLTGSLGKELPRRSLELAMDNLQEVLRLGLRKGDVVTRCSPSQFLVLLPGADLQDSGAVCLRLLRSFSRQYPHSPAAVDYGVYPLEGAE